MDIPDITIVVQWKATCKLTELWQRWGCAVRASRGTGMAILFAEKDLFDDVHDERRNCQAKRKREELSTDLPPSKWTAIAVGLVTAQDGQVTKRGKKDLDVTMDHLINANFRGVSCRRIVVERYFESENTSRFPIVEAGISN